MKRKQFKQTQQYFKSEERPESKKRKGSQKRVKNLRNDWLAEATVWDIDRFLKTSL
jgi:hypothetical protein